jgi:hypothetical protein
MNHQLAHPASASHFQCLQKSAFGLTRTDEQQVVVDLLAHLPWDRIPCSFLQGRPGMSPKIAADLINPNVIFCALPKS